MSVQLKRAYDDVSEDDGIRILVDRIWPRGVSRKELQIKEWMKEIAPSDDLRNWFNHDPEKFETFQKRYQKELEEKEKAEPVKRLLNLSRGNNLTLIYGAKDRKHNQAVVLKDYLEKL